MKTFLKNACVLAALLAAGMVEAREAETLRANLAKQASTLALGPNALPGCVLAAGGEAVPLAYGRVERTKAPVAAATVLDRGRAVQFHTRHSSARRRPTVGRTPFSCASASPGSPAARSRPSSTLILVRRRSRRR